MKRYSGWTKIWIKAKNKKQTITLLIIQMVVNSAGIFKGVWSAFIWGSP